MEVYYCKTKLLGGSILSYPLACFAMLILILLNASCCGGGTVGILVKSNATNFRCDGGLEECLIMEDDSLEIEFLMNPYISRMLAGDGNTGTKASKNPNKAVTCGKPNDPPQNSKCIGQSSGKSNNNPCPPKSAYARYKCP